jgi:hypothetical protein
VGKLEQRIPQNRTGQSSTELFERYLFAELDAHNRRLPPGAGKSNHVIKKISPQFRDTRRWILRQIFSNGDSREESTANHCSARPHPFSGGPLQETRANESWIAFQPAIGLDILTGWVQRLH